jgi:hypothetical protein
MKECFTFSKLEFLLWLSRYRHVDFRNITGEKILLEPSHFLEMEAMYYVIKK